MRRISLLICLVWLYQRESAKLHTNKYTKFSRGVKDPLEVAKLKQVEKLVEIKFRGTTAQVEKLSSSSSSSSSSSLSKAKSSESQMSLEGKTKTGKNVSIAAAIGEGGRSGGAKGEEGMAIVPSDPYTFGFVEIGRISHSHGVKGELKLQIETDADLAEHYLRANTIVFIRRPNRLTPRPIRVTQCRRQEGSLYLLALENILTRQAADLFRGYTLYIRKADRPSLNSNEYLVRDLVGLNCSVNSRIIGHLQGVVLPNDLCESVSATAKMHALLEIKLIGSGKLTLLPFVPSIVTDVNLESKIISLDPPDGLLDLVYDETVKVVLRGFLPEVATLTPEARKWFEALYSVIEKKEAQAQQGKPSQPLVKNGSLTARKAGRDSGAGHASDATSNNNKSLVARRSRVFKRVHPS